MQKHTSNKTPLLAAWWKVLLAGICCMFSGLGGVEKAVADLWSTDLASWLHLFQASMQLSVPWHATAT